MKTGDLVELSAYGKSIKTIHRLKGDLGLVISGAPWHSICVLWSKCGLCWLNRRDVKKYCYTKDQKI